MYQENERRGISVLARVYSSALWGVDAVPVSIEVQILSSLRRFTIVGLPDGVVREAKERVRCAVENSGFPFPDSEVIVNLAPADLPKAGSSYDFAIGAGILAAMGFLEPKFLAEHLLLGELALDGSLKPVRGALAAACLAGEMGLGIVLAEGNRAEASLVEGIPVRTMESLADIAVAPERAEFPRESDTTSVPLPRQLVPSFEKSKGKTFADVVGQCAAKRAIEIAAAGCHNLLMVGPPGSGKSMLAERVGSILPSLSLREQIEVLKVHSADSSQDPDARRFPSSVRPFRSPHHSISSVGLIGGGSFPSPGEVSLAHRGVLFLDEFPHLRRDALEALREPLETQTVCISRSRQRLCFPADFLFVAAMNPCPCGKRGMKGGNCRCHPLQVQKYMERISGPILDRIDLQIWVPPASFRELSTELIEDPTATMRERVERARELQKERCGQEGRTNSRLQPNELRKHCKLEEASLVLLERAANKYQLSARAYSRVLRVARTIADLDGTERIREEHLSEALSYRIGANTVTSKSVSEVGR